MLQKGSFIIPSDMGFIKILKTIQTYKVKKKKHAIFGKFLKFILKSVSPKINKLRKKKTKGIMIRSNFFYKKKDGLFICFFKNAVIPLKKRMNPWNRKLLGPTLLEFKLKKFRVGLTLIINNKIKN